MSGGPLDFNIGELVDRLRNLLKVRGRMPLDLDGRVVPTVRVGDATRAPWRLNERTYTAGGFVAVGAGVGATRFVTVSLPGTPPPAGLLPPALVLEELQVTNLGAATATVDYGHSGFNAPPTALDPPRLVERWPITATPNAELTAGFSINHYPGPAPAAPVSRLGQLIIPTLQTARVQIGAVIGGPTSAVGPIEFYVLAPGQVAASSYGYWWRFRLVER